MTDTLARETPYLRLVPNTGAETEEGVLRAIRRLDPLQRRILAAAIGKAAELEERNGEQAAFEMIDKVIAILRRR